MSTHKTHTMIIGMAGMAEFGALVRNARESQGMTGVELAGKIGRPHPFVVRIETAKNSNPPDPKTMDDLSRVLHIPKPRMLEVLGYLDREDSGRKDMDDPRAHLIGIIDQHEWDWAVALEIADMIQWRMSRQADRMTALSAIKPLHGETETHNDT